MTSTHTSTAVDGPTPPRRRGTVVPTLVVVAVIVLVGLVVAVLSIRPGTGGAPIEHRPLAGTGSDTTADVLEGLSGVIPEIGTWPAGAGGTIVTKDPEQNGSCTLAVPADDAQGVAALVAQQSAAGNGVPCLDFARSSVDGSNRPELATAGLTYIPFAVDAATFAQRADSPNPRTLTSAQLREIYTCAAPAETHLPLLPAHGSGLRAVFLSAIGLADSADFTTLNPCVTALDPADGENVGGLMTDPRNVLPFSVAQYLAQGSTVSRDGRGGALLGQVDGVAPVVATDPSAIGLVSRDDTLNSRALGVEDLRTLYTCAAPPVTLERYAPLLPGPGSTVRAAFLSAIGLVDTPDFTTTHSCVRDTDASGGPLPENVGTVLTDSRNLAPYAVEQYLAQVGGTVQDVHGSTGLAAVGADAVMRLNPAFPLVHDVYTVVPTERLAEEPLASVFVGDASRVCRSTDTITRYGFGLADGCGDTSLRTPG